MPSLGKLAGKNPWEVLHKILNGQPGANMPALRSLDISYSINILTYLQQGLSDKQKIAGICFLALEWLNEEDYDVAVEIDAGFVSEGRVDSMVANILTVMFEVGLFDESIIDYGGLSDTEERRAIALETARKSMVLLKNEKQVLPLNKSEIK